MPGETYQTLKFKATQQAKKSGMSQTAAENYGSVMATNAAVQGKATDSPEFLGSNKTQKRATQAEILGNITQTTTGVAEERKEAEKKMQEAGGVYNPQTGQVIYPEKKDDIFQTIQNELKDAAEDASTMFSGIKGIFSGPEIQRLTPAQLRRVKKILADYRALGITNPNKLRALTASNFGGGIFGKDQRYSDMEGNIVDPDKILFEGDKMFITNEKGQKVEVRRTKEGTTELLEEEGSGIMKSLQKFNPELYYPYKGMPQTTGGLEELAGIDAQKYGQRFLGDGVTPNPNYNPDFARQIFEARQTLGTEKLRQEQAGFSEFPASQGGGAAISGIAGISPLPGLVEDVFGMDITQPDDVVLGYGPGDQPYTAVIPRSGYQYTYDQEGRRYEIPIGGDQSGTTYGGNPFTFREGEPWQAPVGDKLTTAAAAATPFDYSQWPQFDERYPGHYSNLAPSYAANGGIVSQARPQYDYWNRIANAFPGMR